MNEKVPIDYAHGIGYKVMGEVGKYAGLAGLLYFATDESGLTFGEIFRSAIPYVGGSIMNIVG